MKIHENIFKIWNWNGNQNYDVINKNWISLGNKLIWKVFNEAIEYPLWVLSFDLRKCITIIEWFCHSIRYAICDMRTRCVFHRSIKSTFPSNKSEPYRHLTHTHTCHNVLHFFFFFFSFVFWKRKTVHIHFRMHAKNLLIKC